MRNLDVLMCLCANVLINPSCRRQRCRGVFDSRRHPGLPTGVKKCAKNETSREFELNTKLLAFIFLNSRNHGGNTKRTAH